MADDKVITFGQELDPDEQQNYRDRIAAARNKGGVHALKGSTPVGGVERPKIPLLRREEKVEASPMTDGGGVQPRPAGSPVIRQETAQQLQDFAKAQAAEVEKAKQEAAVEKKDEEKGEDIDKLFESFDFDSRNEAERILNNKTRRKEIETRCSEMKIEDLIMEDEVRQVVPILPEKFVVVFRSMTPDESLFIKRLLAKETVQTDTYIMEKFGLLQLACSLVSINGRVLPHHIDKDGDVDEASFTQKLKMICKKSGYIVADLGLNYMWFDIRVRRLLNPEKMGNG